MCDGGGGIKYFIGLKNTYIFAKYSSIRKDVFS